jgi:hypothetical protein
MWDWIEANAATMLVGAGVLLAILGVVLHLVREKKKGKSACGCSCAGCASREQCQSKNK